MLPFCSMNSEAVDLFERDLCQLVYDACCLAVSFCGTLSRGSSLSDVCVLFFFQNTLITENPKRYDGILGTLISLNEIKGMSNHRTWTSAV